MSEFSPDIGNTVTQLLGRTAMLTNENRILRNDLARLLTALGVDPDREDVEAGISIAEALVGFLTASEDTAWPP